MANLNHILTMNIGKYEFLNWIYEE